METFPLPKVGPVGGQAKASRGTHTPRPSEAPGVAWSLPPHSQVFVLRAAGRTRTRVPPGRACGAPVSQAWVTAAVVA